MAVKCEASTDFMQKFQAVKNAGALISISDLSH